jgi:hypothetical protein
MFLSGPIIAYLKADTEPTAFLPPEIYEHFLAVLVYSFTDEQDQADSYLLMLKDKLRHWHFIKRSKYDNFLVCLIEKLKQKDSKWFKKLSVSTKTVSDTLEIVVQRKIESFTPDLCAQMIDDDSFIQ